MPTYVYRCSACGSEREISLPIDERDTVVVCQDLSCGAKRAGVTLLEFADKYPKLLRYAARMVRIPTAASFEIKGYSAKNGYSK